MASYQYSNEILLGRAEPGKGKYESVYSNEFATAWTSGGDTTAYQPASAINLLKRFADIIAVSGTTNGAAIYTAVNGLDALGVPSND
jgi:hypothetical protein